MAEKKYSTTLGEKIMELEKTNLASQANAAVIARLGETTVMATAVMSKKPREGISFFPLTVDYEEKFSAAGKILGSRFIRREARPSEEAVLSGRLIDRSIRPLFPKKMRNDVQVIITVLSIDGANDPDIPALAAASAALHISDIPWKGPAAGVRIGQNKDNWVLCPTYEERASGGVDIVVAGTKSRVNMIEAGLQELSEEKTLDAIELGKKTFTPLIELIETMRQEIGKEKIQLALEELPQEAVNIFRERFTPILKETIFQPTKKEFHRGLDQLKEEWMNLAREEGFSTTLADFLFEEELEGAIHQSILGERRRPDGREMEEIRPLEAAVGLLPRVHGSGLFIRGDTKILSTLTLGAPGDELMIQGMEIRGTKRFMHHYNFPPYSVGEIAPLRGPGRREIGHGALVERALSPVIPQKENFPYTIRIVSEALSSNGSTSMASCCASTLALMDAGVPIAKPVAGIAMGLMTDQEERWQALTDLQGPEDHQGDMDFKIAGTREGITVIQLDVKIEGLTMEMISSTLKQARQARLEILDVMAKSLAEPRKELSPWAPRIISTSVPVDRIRDVIGPGGKTINEIIATTGAAIDIEDDGRIYITADSQEAAQKALERIRLLTREIKVGEVFEGKVTRIFPFGAMMELGPRQEGLIHISELDTKRVDRVEDVMKVGDRVSAKVINIDDQGRVNLSRRELLTKELDHDQPERWRRPVRRIHPDRQHSRDHRPNRRRLP